MKKLIAMALFFVSAMTMSAQSVTIIEQNSIKDADIIAALENPNYALVDFSNPALNEAVAEINKQVAALELDRNEALDALEDAIKELEMRAGDYNVDGYAESDDVDDLFNDIMSGTCTFDFNGDGYIESDDVDDLFNYIMFGTY